MSNYQVPELAAVGDKFAKQDLADLATTRKFFRQAAAHLPAYDSNRKLRITDVVMPGYQGEPDVAGRVYAPDDAGEAVPGSIYLFSGGYVVGSIEMIDHESRCSPTEHASPCWPSPTAVADRPVDSLPCGRTASGGLRSRPWVAITGALFAVLFATRVKNLLSRGQPRLVDES